MAPLDVLVRMGWLEPVRVDEWRQGRLPALERGVQVNLHKLSTAMAILPAGPATAVWCPARLTMRPAPGTAGACGSR